MLGQVSAHLTSLESCARSFPCAYSQNLYWLFLDLYLIQVTHSSRHWGQSLFTAVPTPSSTGSLYVHIHFQPVLAFPGVLVFLFLLVLWPKSHWTEQRASAACRPDALLGLSWFQCSSSAPARSEVETNRKRLFQIKAIVSLWPGQGFPPPTRKLSWVRSSRLPWQYPVHYKLWSFPSDGSCFPASWEIWCRFEETLKDWVQPSMPGC